MQLKNTNIYIYLHIHTYIFRFSGCFTRKEQQGNVAYGVWREKKLSGSVEDEAVQIILHKPREKERSHVQDWF